MNGYCLLGEHSGCPDTLRDEYLCACQCHIEREVGA